MPDYFDSAQQGNDKTKAALLDAIRTQGSQARTAFEQSQAAIAQQKQQALAAALAEAQQRNAPQQVIDQNTATISSGYDRRLADLQSSQASRSAGFDSMGAAAGTYFDQANAALPALRTRQQMQAATIAQQLANQQAQLRAQHEMANSQGQREVSLLGMNLEDRKQQREYEAQQREAQRLAAERQAVIDSQQQAHRTRLEELQLAIAEANLAKAQVGDAPEPTSVSKMLSETFGNQQGFADYVDQATGQVNVAGQQRRQQDIVDTRKLGARGNLAARAEANLTPLYSPVSTSDVAEQVGGQLGFSPGVGSALIRPAATKAQTAAEKKADAQYRKDNPDRVALGKKVGLSVKGVEDMMGSKEYAKAEQLAELYLQQGRTLDELKQALGSAKELTSKPKTRAAILDLYGGLFV